jgi:hypothetical protein
MESLIPRMVSIGRPRLRCAAEAAPALSISIATASS